MLDNPAIWVAFIHNESSIRSKKTLVPSYTNASIVLNIRVSSLACCSVNKTVFMVERRRL